MSISQMIKTPQKIYDLLRRKSLRKGFIFKNLAQQAYIRFRSFLKNKVYFQRAHLDSDLIVKISSPGSFLTTLK